VQIGGRESHTLAATDVQMLSGPLILPPSSPATVYVAGISASANTFTDKTENYELGLKGSFLDRKLSADVSVYSIDWNNIQLKLSTNGYGYNGNAGGAKSEGLEAFVVAKPLNGLTASA
jgi:outer membrane receptor protein involved in Fe transport